MWLRCCIFHKPYYPACALVEVGTIVNIGSIAGRFVTPGAGAYHISKYGVTALSLALRAEVRPFGVRVVLIEPTGVRYTELLRSPDRGAATWRRSRSLRR